MVGDNLPIVSDINQVVRVQSVLLIDVDGVIEVSQREDHAGAHLPGDPPRPRHPRPRRDDITGNQHIPRHDHRPDGAHKGQKNLGNPPVNAALMYFP